MCDWDGMVVRYGGWWWWWGIWYCWGIVCREGCVGEYYCWVWIEGLGFIGVGKYFLELERVE